MNQIKRIIENERKDTNVYYNKLNRAPNSDESEKKRKQRRFCFGATRHYKQHDIQCQWYERG